MNFNTEKLLENLCRTCMDEPNDNIFSIFDETERVEEKVTIKDLLLLTTPQLNIEIGDMLPKILCGSCLERLIKAYEFQTMCIRVEEKLRQMSRAHMDPLNESADVNQAVTELTKILKMEMDEPILDIDVPLTDSKKQYEDVCILIESKQQLNTDGSAQLDDDSSVGSEWVPPKSMILKTESVEQNSGKLCDITSKSPKGSKKNDQSTKSNKDDQSKNVVCDECGSRLKTAKNLKRHKKIHLKIATPARKKSNQPITKYECDECKKVFQQSSSLKDHRRTHTGEQPYLCSECGKAFKSLSNMKQHFLRHGTDRPYVCPDCPKRFPCLSDLASHKIVHNNKKSHVCDICGAGFSKPYLLKKHNMYHTGEKNHKCDYCDMRFVLADHCRRHMRTHTGEKPYKCKYCVRAFAQSNDLIKHLRGHLGDNVYKCDLCPQGFRLHGDLRAHFYTHKNDDEETRARNLQALKDEEQRIQMKLGLVERK